MLFEILLVRLALLDRTVVIEELLAQLGGGAEPPTPNSVPAQTSSRRATAPNEPRRAAPPTAMDSAVARSLTPSADQAPRAQPNEERKAPTSTGTLDLAVIQAKWDDFRASVRRDKPVLATFVDKATPLRCTPSGALVLEVSDRLARESLEARLADLTALARAHFGGVTQVMLRESAVSRRLNRRRA